MMKMTSVAYVDRVLSVLSMPLQKKQFLSAHSLSSKKSDRVKKMAYKDFFWGDYENRMS
jgi:hypothetical protein